MPQAVPQEIRLKRREQPYFSLNNSIFDSGIAAGIGPHAFSLYAYLCRRAGRSETAWPSQSTMAKNTGISVRMVDKCIIKLEASGLIRRDGWKGQTREIEILDDPSTTAQGADTSAQGADPICTGCRSTSAQGADNKDTVDKDTVIKTQDKETTEQDALILEPLPVKLPGNLKPGTWEDFKASRKALKAKMTDRAEKILLKQLSAMSAEGQDAEKIVEQSIAAGWKGLFPLKEQYTRAQKQNEKAMSDDEIWEANEALHANTPHNILDSRGNNFFGTDEQFYEHERNIPESERQHEKTIPEMGHQA